MGKITTKLEFLYIAFKVYIIFIFIGQNRLKPKYFIIVLEIYNFGDGPLPI